MEPNSFAETKCEVTIPVGLCGAYQGTFSDNYENSSTNQYRCMARANEYYRYCKISNSWGQIPQDRTVSVSFIKDGVVLDSRTGKPPKVSRCKIDVINGCSTGYVGSFIDKYSTAPVDPDRCLARAEEWQSVCGSKAFIMATFSFNDGLNEKVTISAPAPSN